MPITTLWAARARPNGRTGCAAQAPPYLEPFVGVEQDRDGAVVDERHVHHGAEDARGDRQPGAPQLLREEQVEAIGLLGARRVDVRRAPAAPRVAEKSE